MVPAQCSLTPVPFTDLRFHDSFWYPRIETNRAVTIPHIYRKLEETGRTSAFALDFERLLPASNVLIFGDSDPAKWIEAASYSIATYPDPNLAAMVDRVVPYCVWNNRELGECASGSVQNNFTRIHL